VSESTVGEPVALLATLTDPLREPGVDGWNVAVTVHDAPTARLEPQLFVCEKSPDAAIDEMLAAAVPVFFSTDVCDALVAPTLVFAKARLPGVNPRIALVGGGVFPPPNTCNSESWPAVHPEFAVMLIRT